MSNNRVFQRPASLQPGQCYSQPESKNYLSSLKAQPTKNSNTIKEIGVDKINGLKDTDSENFYFCKVRCKQTAGDISSFWITQSDSPSQFSQMSGFLCAGITVENVQIVGSVYGLQPVIHIFNGYEASFLEIHDWLKANQFSLEAKTAHEKLNELQVTFNKVAAAYIIADSPALKEAALILSKMVDGSVEGKTLLKKYVVELTQANWQFKVDFQNSKSIVQNMLNLNGRFLEYSIGSY